MRKPLEIRSRFPFHFSPEAREMLIILSVYFILLGLAALGFALTLDQWI